MKIYIHTTENSMLLKKGLPASLEYVFFNYLSDLDLKELFDNNVKQFIFCVDDISIETEINDNYSSILIVSQAFLADHFKNYNHFYSKSSLHTLLHKAVVLFSGFENKELLIELQFKVIVMGGRVTCDLSTIESCTITHIIPYRLIGHDLETILKVFPYKKKIYTQAWIEFFWNNSLVAIHSHDTLNNPYFQDTFEVKYFFNCRVVLLGFDNESLSEMIGTIVDNRGTVFQLDHADSADFIIVPNDFQKENFLIELKNIPIKALKNIVYHSWWIKSIEDRWLADVAEYRVFPSKDIIDEDDFKEQFIDNSQISISGLFNESFDQSQNEESVISVSNIPVQNYEMESHTQAKKNIKSYIETMEYHPDTLQYGYNPSALTDEKIAKKELQRLLLIKDYDEYIKSKVSLLNNLQELKSNNIIFNAKLNVLFDVYQEILDFLQILYNILHPLVDNYTPDCCLALEIILHYSEIKKYFRSYNLKLNKITDIVERIDHENSAIKECFHRYVEKNNVLNIKFIADVPEKIIMDLSEKLKNVIGNTSVHHPDLRFFIEISKRNQTVIQFLNTTKDSYFEAKNQLLLIDCIGNPGIFSKGNRYRTVVDCIQISEDSLEIPVSLFIFENSLAICRFKDRSLAFQRYESVKKKMRTFADNIKEGELSNWPSKQSLMSESPLSIKSISRNDSNNSGNSCRITKKILHPKYSKFHKLFTGLSELSWAEKPKNLYEHVEVFDKLNITTVISYYCTFCIEKQLYFEIKYIDKTGSEKSLTLHLIPRVLKNAAKYNALKTAQPNEIEGLIQWGADLKWDTFILEEKLNFCNMFAQHYEAKLFEEPLTQRLAFDLEDKFKTPHMSKSIKKPSMCSTKSKMSPFNSQSSMKNQTFGGSIRRLSKFFKRQSSSGIKFNKNIDYYLPEDEPTMLSGIEYQSISKPRDSFSSPIDFITQKCRKRKSNTGLDQKKKSKN